MNHAKIVLVAFISAFVAITTAFLGVAGTIIGSVLSSVLYNVLSEILEKPVTERQFSLNFEYEIAYVFPLIVISIIQLLLIAAFLSQWGILPGTFLNAYLSIQGVVDNNLYRILGGALVVMAIYPFIIKPNIVKKSYGLIIGFVGIIFLSRGFSDAHLTITNIYDTIFQYFDFEIEIFAFILLVIVIILILNNASQSNKDFNASKQKVRDGQPVKTPPVKNVNHRLSFDDLDDLKLKDAPLKKFEYSDEFKDDYIPYERKSKAPKVVKKPYTPKRIKPESKENKYYNRPDIGANDHLPQPQRNPLINNNRGNRKY